MIEDPVFPPDSYRAPDWLRYCRAIYFDGYSPPVWPHIRDFDARRLVECARELGGDTLRFQPIGYYAYYPTKSFPVHAELGTRDLMDEAARECRRQGMHVYCYCPYMVFFTSVGWVDTHPEFAEWVRRDPDGKAVGSATHLGWMASQQLCMFGDAYRQAIRRVIREYCEHDIDGVYLDAPSTYGYSGFCFCSSCRRNYKRQTGFEIDRLTNPEDREAQAAWYDWGHKCTFEDLSDFRKMIHGSGKFLLCHNASSWRGQSLKLQYRAPDGFMIEHAGQTHERLMHGMLGAAMARPYRKLPQMYLGSYCVSNFNQPPHLKPWAVHNTNIEDGDEIRMEGFANLASGGVPLYATLNRKYFGIGSGSAEPVREVYDVMRRSEALLKDSVPVTHVSVVPTWEALQRWRAGARTFNLEMSEAFLLAMLDSGIAAGVCPSTEVNEDWLKEQRVVALCGASGVSNETAALLAAWVKRGGGLLATYDTGLYDAGGRPRKDGGALREVLGVEMTGEPGPAVPECYYHVRAAHPALGEYAAGAVLQGDNRFVPVTVASRAVIVADCWNLGEKRTFGPAIVTNGYGEGHAAYVSGSLESHYSTGRIPSVRRLLESVVQYLGRRVPPPFRVAAPCGVYGVLRRAVNGDLALWVLAPVGFKDAAIGRMRQEFVPLTNIEVRVRIPEGRRLKAVRLVRASRTASHSISNGYAVVTLPALHIAELVHFEIA